MVDYLKSALEFLKLAPRYLISIGVAAAFLLFGNEDFLARLGLKKFTEDYRAWLGLTFVSTVSLFAIYVAGEIVSPAGLNAATMGGVKCSHPEWVVWS